MIGKLIGALRFWSKDQHHILNRVRHLEEISINKCNFFLDEEGEKLGITKIKIANLCNNVDKLIKIHEAGDRIGGYIKDMRIDILEKILAIEKRINKIERIKARQK